MEVKNGIPVEKQAAGAPCELGRRCVICAAGPVERPEALRPFLREDDWVIAADGGQRLARRLSLRPALIVADFDSSSSSDNREGIPTAVLPVKKDDTDTMAAARIAVEKGFREVLILGGTGGRLDHTAANFAVLAYLSRQGVRAVMADEHGCTEMLLPGRHHVEAQAGMMLSLLPYGGMVSGLWVKNAEYELENAVLTTDFPLGVSNAFVGDAPVEIEFTGGILQLFLSKD